MEGLLLRDGLVGRVGLLLLLLLRWWGVEGLQERLDGKEHEESESGTHRGLAERMDGRRVASGARGRRRVDLRSLDAFDT